jgi:hypothetical protein
MQVTPLSNKHLRTLKHIFQSPASHNLEWKDVTSLIEHLGTVEEQHDGRMKFTMNGGSEVFHRTHDKKDVSDVAQVIDIRRFLVGAGVQPDGTLTHPFYAEPHTPDEHRAAEDYAGVPPTATEPEAHRHDHGTANTERNRHADQELKTQQHEQNNRNAFPKGLAQEHTKGNS